MPQFVAYYSGVTLAHVYPAGMSRGTPAFAIDNSSIFDAWIKVGAPAPDVAPSAATVQYFDAVVKSGVHQPFIVPGSWDGTLTIRLAEPSPATVATSDPFGSLTVQAYAAGEDPGAPYVLPGRAGVYIPSSSGVGPYILPAGIAAGSDAAGIPVAYPVVTGATDPSVVGCNLNWSVGAGTQTTTIAAPGAGKTLYLSAVFVALTNTASASQLVEVNVSGLVQPVSIYAVVTTTQAYSAQFTPAVAIPASAQNTPIQVQVVFVTLAFVTTTAQGAGQVTALAVVRQPL